jgi:hypothetical protein
MSSAERRAFFPENPMQPNPIRSTTTSTLLGASLLTALMLAGCDRPDVPSAQPAAPAATTSPAGTPASAPAAATPAPTVSASGAAGFVPADTSVPLAPMASCNFEQVDGQPYAAAPLRVGADAEFVVTGFAYDAARETVPADLRLRVIAADGAAWEAPVRGRMDRPDVPTYFKLGDWARPSGFEQLLSSRGLAPGEYRLVLVFSGDGKQFACDNGRRLAIGG